MNTELTTQIIKHILSGLKVIPSSWINPNNKSLMSKEFLLKEKIIFGDGEDIIENNMWGCQMMIGQQEMKIILADCSQDNIGEIALIVHLKDAPAYGLYLCIENNTETDPIISCSLNGKDWMECNTYLQATFLAGMEQVREISVSWTKCQEYSEQYQMMLSFIKFCDLLIENE